jgi:hypothetical protein
MLIVIKDGAFKMSEFSVQQILELACAAQRVNGDYIKETLWVYDDEMKPLYRKEPNKFLMLFTLGCQPHYDDAHRPDLLKITQEDQTQAEEIRKYFRKFMFGAIAGENEFQTEVNTILNSDTVKQNKFGFIACLPSVMARDVKKTIIKKTLRDCDNEPLAQAETKLDDLDCEIVEVKRSNNFDAWNISAIINNKIVSWFSKNELKPGPCVVIKAKVKTHGENWTTKKVETRLNYVKVAQ